MAPPKKTAVKAAARKETPPQEPQEESPTGTRKRKSNAHFEKQADELHQLSQKEAREKRLREFAEVNPAAETQVEEPDTDTEDKKSVTSHACSSTDVTKDDLSGFVTMAKKSNNEDVLAAYHSYKSCSRFDEKKKQIVALWKSDKSCKWWNSWEQTEVKEEATECDDYAGYGTKSQPHCCRLAPCFS